MPVYWWDLFETSSLLLKGKFFDSGRVVGFDNREWMRAFTHGDFAIFRLTPDKYHYNHTPVAGIVSACYEIPGKYHSCNPGVIVTTVTP